MDPLGESAESQAQSLGNDGFYDAGKGYLQAGGPQFAPSKSQEMPGQPGSAD